MCDGLEMMCYRGAERAFFLRKSLHVYLVNDYICVTVRAAQIDAYCCKKHKQQL